MKYKISWIEIGITMWPLRITLFTMVTTKRLYGGSFIQILNIYEELGLPLIIIIIIFLNQDPFYEVDL